MFLRVPVDNLGKNSIFVNLGRKSQSHTQFLANLMSIYARMNIESFSQISIGLSPAIENQLHRQGVWANKSKTHRYGLFMYMKLPEGRAPYNAPEVAVMPDSRILMSYIMPNTHLKSSLPHH